MSTVFDASAPLARLRVDVIPIRRAAPVDSPRPMYSYYDREADIVWIPTGASDDAVSQKTSWGLIDHDAKTDEIVGVEVWEASTRLPADLLAALPAPGASV
jgi:uncharacterized protein YuzE